MDNNDKDQDYVEAWEHRMAQQAYFDRALLDKGKKQSETSKLTDQIIRHIKSIGGAARRVNSQGQWDMELQKWRYSGMKKGFEDVSAIVPIKITWWSMGLYFAIEVKRGKDKFSPEQIKRKEEVERSSGIYIVAKTFDQFREEFETKIKEIQNAIAKATGDTRL